MQTGCRYGELTRLEVQDYNPDAGTLAIRESKGKPRHVVLTEEGAAFFTALCAGRAGSEVMLRHADGRPWAKSEQGRPMAEPASERAYGQAFHFTACGIVGPRWLSWLACR